MNTTTNTCPRCRRPLAHDDGTPTRQHNPRDGYFGVTICELSNVQRQRLVELQEQDYRHRLVFGW